MPTNHASLFFFLSSRFSILMDMAVMFLILRLTPHRWSILRMGSSMQLLTLIIIKVTGNWLAFDLWPLCSLIDICLFVSIRWIRTRCQPRHSAGASSWRHRWCRSGDVGRRCDGIGPRLSVFRILTCLREPSLTPPDLQHGKLFPRCFNFAFTPHIAQVW